MVDCTDKLKDVVDAASHSPWSVCIVTDVPTPPTPLQSIAVYHNWHTGDLYKDWFAASLSMSDDAELRAIAEGLKQAADIRLGDIHDIHVFSDSMNALR